MAKNVLLIIGAVTGLVAAGVAGYKVKENRLRE